jgi:hypothetical protein
MQPRPNRLLDAATLPRQLEKCLLGDILRYVGVLGDTQRGGMNHRPMCLHQLTKGVSIAVAGVALERLEVGEHGFS